MIDHRGVIYHYEIRIVQIKQARNMSGQERAGVRTCVCVCVYYNITSFKIGLLRKYTFQYLFDIYFPKL